MTPPSLSQRNDDRGGAANDSFPSYYYYLPTTAVDTNPTTIDRVGFDLESFQTSFNDERRRSSTTIAYPSVFAAVLQQHQTPPSGYVSAAIYWLIFVVGCVGNTLVVVVVATRGRRTVGFMAKQPAMRVFVGSLAASDLGLLFGVAWIHALLGVDPTWRLGVAVCKLHTVWRSMTASCSIWTLMVISVTRCASTAA